MSDKTVSLLIVDPEPQDIIQSLKQLSPNLVFHHASSGKFALDFLAAQRVDCVLLELDLKDMSGFQILNHLVPTPTKPTIAVVVWTRLTHQSLLLIAQHLGAQAAFDKKSTTPIILYEAIKRAIHGYPSYTLSPASDHRQQARPS